MLCHCGQNMWRHYSGKLKVSGILREKFKCSRCGYRLVTYEGMPVMTESHHPGAVNASGLTAEKVAHRKGLAIANLIRNTARGHQSSKGLAAALSQPHWSEYVRSSSAAGSPENNSNNAAMVV